MLRRALAQRAKARRGRVPPLENPRDRVKDRERVKVKDRVRARGKARGKARDRDRAKGRDRQAWARPLVPQAAGGDRGEGTSRRTRA